MSEPSTGRLLILSDTHFGRPRWGVRAVESLRPLWQGFDHLIINGDVAEVHHPIYATRAARAVVQLFDLCERDSVHLTLLSGNHDPYITDQRHLTLAGGSIFVTHGDVLHPAVAPWSPAAARMREVHDAALAAISQTTRDELEARLTASQLAAHAEWEELAREARRSRMRGMLIRPWALVRVLQYWRRMPRLAYDFVAEHSPESAYVIVGHTHHQGIWRINERTIINTGSYGFPGRPWGVAVEQGSISVLPIRRRHGAYGLGDAPLLQEALPIAARNTRPGTGAPSDS